MDLVGLIRKSLFVLLWGALLSCNAHSDRCDRPLAPCSRGVCIHGRCEPGTADFDGDGLANELEVELGTDPTSFDTDGDGVGDLEEVGDPSHPLDWDGDGKGDVFESATEDKDGDCIKDQFDGHDTSKDDSPELVALLDCSRKGVCGSAMGKVKASCVQGKATCDYSAIAHYEPVEVTCDGLDNDCDGEVDEGFSLAGVPIGFKCMGTGQCGAGVVECGPDGLKAICSSMPGGSADQSSPEVCDGLDNDCDGETDEGIELHGVPLGGECEGEGECGPGKVECLDGKPVCSTEPGSSQDQSSPEVCDGLDNDCNGIVDDIQAPLPGTPLDYCQVKGICAAHVDQVALVCVDGKPACSFLGVPGYSEGQEVSCDGRDEDCDGTADEDFTYVDPFLGERKVGEECGWGNCVGGKVVCSADGSRAECSTHSKAGTETCNDVDDDCDGYIDQGLTKDFVIPPVLVSAGSPGERVGVAAGLVGDKVYLYGGARTLDSKGQATKAYKDLWVYDTKLHTFSLVTAQGPSPRAFSMLIYDESRERLWLVGGALQDQAVQPLYYYDLSTQEFHELPIFVEQAGATAGCLKPGGDTMVLARLDQDQSTVRLVGLDGSDFVETGVVVPVRREGAAVCDPQSGAIMEVGGVDGQGDPRGDIVLVSAEGQVQVLPVQGLPGRYRHGAALVGGDHLILVGGKEGQGDGPGSVVLVSLGTLQAKEVEVEGLPTLLWPSVVTLQEKGVWLTLFGLDTSKGEGNLAAFSTPLPLDGGPKTANKQNVGLSPPPVGGAHLLVLPHYRKAYLVGGWTQGLSGPKPQRKVYVLDLDDLHYSVLGLADPLPVRLHSAAAADSAKDLLYLFGGDEKLQGDGGTDTLFVVDPLAKSWGQVKPSGPWPEPVRDAALVSIGPGKLLLYGGRNALGVSGQLWMYVQGQGFQAFSAPGKPRYGHRGFLVGSTVLFVGGLPKGDLLALDLLHHTFATLYESPLLDGSGFAAVMDEDSRKLLFLAGDGTALLIILTEEPSVAGAVEVDLRSRPSFWRSAAYDRLFRRGLTVGGSGVDEVLSSATWVLEQECP